MGGMHEDITGAVVLVKHTNKRFSLWLLLDMESVPAPATAEEEERNQGTFYFTPDNASFFFPSSVVKCHYGGLTHGSCLLLSQFTVIICLKEIICLKDNHLQVVLLCEI